jgi:hypothetical protein
MAGRSLPFRNESSLYGSSTYIENCILAQSLFTYIKKLLSDVLIVSFD